MILARSVMYREEAKQHMFEERAVRDERVRIYIYTHIYRERCSASTPLLSMHMLIYYSVAHAES